MPLVPFRSGWSASPAGCLLFMASPADAALLLLGHLAQAYHEVAGTTEGDEEQCPICRCGGGASRGTGACCRNWHA